MEMILVDRIEGSKPYSAVLADRVLHTPQLIKLDGNLSRW